MYLVDYNFYNTAQLKDTIPVIIEQTDAKHLEPISIEMQGLLNDQQKILYKDRLNIPGLQRILVDNSFSHYAVAITPINFWATLNKFKSKLKGIVKFRQIFSNLSYPIYDDNGHLYGYSTYVGGKHGVMWSVEAFTFGIKFLQEQNARWIRINTNNTKSSLLEKLKIFYSSATGQSAIIQDNLVVLYSLLNNLPVYINNALAYLNAINRNDLKPLTITNNQFMHLFFINPVTNRNKNTFVFDKLGCIFKEARKQLENLMDTFTRNTVEIKFLQASPPEIPNEQRKKRK